jgi:hypothetical protein
VLGKYREHAKHGTTPIIWLSMHRSGQVDVRQESSFVYMGTARSIGSASIKQTPRLRAVAKWAALSATMKYSFPTSQGPGRYGVPPLRPEMVAPQPAPHVCFGFRSGSCPTPTGPSQLRPPKFNIICRPEVPGSPLLLSSYDGRNCCAMQFLIGDRDKLTPGPKAPKLRCMRSRRQRHIDCRTRLQWAIFRSGFASVSEARSRLTSASQNHRIKSHHHSLSGS